MHHNRRWIPAVACLAVTATSCQEPPPAQAEPTEPAPSESATADRLPLKEIMGGLEADLANVAHGIWIADSEIVRAAATRIADHPKVLAEQMGVIQTELGTEFPAFVQQDQAVHGAAVELAEASDAIDATAESFEIYLRLQQGCVSCHTAFRARVTEALNAEGAGS